MVAPIWTIRVNFLKNNTLISQFTSIEIKVKKNIRIVPLSVSIDKTY